MVVCRYYSPCPGPPQVLTPFDSFPACVDARKQFVGSYIAMKMDCESQVDPDTNQPIPNSSVYFKLAGQMAPLQPCIMHKCCSHHTYGHSEICKGRIVRLSGVGQYSSRPKPACKLKQRLPFDHPLRLPRLAGELLRARAGALPWWVVPCRFFFKGPTAWGMPASPGGQGIQTLCAHTHPLSPTRKQNWSLLLSHFTGWHRVYLRQFEMALQVGPARLGGSVPTKGLAVWLHCSALI